MNSINKVVLIIIFMLTVSGCDTAENVTIHEPGVYMGANDPLSTNTEKLQERMQLQKDR